MTDFVVHSIPGSPFGRSVLALLEERGAHWRLAPVAPGAQRSAAHLALHPFGRVPVLQHGDFLLYETQAILRYLDRALPGPALTPTDPKTAARMDQAMSINDWYLFQGAARIIVFHRIVGPMLLGTTPDEAAIAAAMPAAHTVIDELARTLADHPFFTGDTLTLADLHLAPQLSMLAATPEWLTLAAGYPNLSRWIERMEDRPSFVATTWERLTERARAA